MLWLRRQHNSNFQLWRCGLITFLVDDQRRFESSTKQRDRESERKIRDQNHKQRPQMCNTQIVYNLKKTETECSPKRNWEMVLCRKSTLSGKFSWSSVYLILLLFSSIIICKLKTLNKQHQLHLGYFLFFFFYRREFTVNELTRSFKLFECTFFSHTIILHWIYVCVLILMYHKKFVKH